MENNKIGSPPITVAGPERSGVTGRRRGVGAVLVLALVALLGGCEEEQPAAVVSEELLELDASNVLFGVEHVMTQDGVREALLVADTAYQWQDSTSMGIRGMTLTVFAEDGEERAEVTADRGLFEQGSNRMVARGNVVLLVRSDGRRIESSELHYDPEANRIWSDSATVMYTGDRIVEGTGFDANAEFTDVTVRNGRTRGGVRF